MEFIRQFNGAVFFVDILGIGALTKGQIDLNDADYAEWLSRYPYKPSHQYLAAAILAEFRQILINLPELNEVTITQLSDCAFIWSEDLSAVLKFCSKFMYNAIQRGILCRGGLSFGEIIITDQEHDGLGKFIVGKAVTEAVGLEGIAKGARVLINKEVINNLSNYPDFNNNFREMFSSFTNPLDFAEYSEFRWYLCRDIDLIDTNLSRLSPIRRVELTKQRLKIANLVKCSPKFLWNSKSDQGKAQLNATVKFLAENNLLGVRHSLAWQGKIERELRTVQHYEDLINKDRYNPVAQEEVV